MNKPLKNTLSNKVNMKEGNKNTLNYIDLFSGVGGMSLGFEEEGFENIFSIDFDKTFCETYKKNFPKNRVIEKDIKDLTEKEILDLTKGKKIDLIIGGTPCQGFSIAGNIGRNFIDDPRNHLFKEFARIVKILRPKIFIIENVARVFNHNNGETRKEIISLFNEYKVDCKILNSADYGVPQIRKRVFFIGNRIGIENKFPEKNVNEYKIIKQVIDDLPKLSSGEISIIPNHEAMNHTEQMLNKMAYVSNGGSRNQIPENIRPKKGDPRKYIRYDENKPSICITGDMRKVFHYSQNRALTVRELARIQSFPDNFIFLGNRISQQQQVGNAVPPLMARAVAKLIKKELENGK
jgi:DNA (cytosine-5)-methyltransferase 1